MGECEMVISVSLFNSNGKLPFTPQKVFASNLCTVLCWKGIIC